MRRRYELRHDPVRQRYIVEMLDDNGQRREAESYADWATADHMRTELNRRLEERDELLPERRR